MADTEFGTKVPELYLLTLEKIPIDDGITECAVLDENVIGSTFRVVLSETKRTIDNMARISRRDPFYISNKPWLEYVDANCPCINYTPR